ncbi:MAG TPA: hypothetical protein VMU14_05365 [Acidimicrobiales bacterium]|nr:hypothetical protein [Acidimicrobiales bacterium]
MTVVAPEAWLAEVLSKAVFLGGLAASDALLARSGASALVVPAARGAVTALALTTPDAGPVS